MATEFNPLRDLKAGIRKAAACDSHPPLRRSESVEEADLWWRSIHLCSPNARREHLRWFALNDLFFFAVFMLHRWHLIGEASPIPERETKEEREKREGERDGRKAKWCFERASEVFLAPDGYGDLWTREHGKSEIITFALSIQNILRDPNVTIGIFSHNKFLAKKHLKLIKTEFEDNHELQALFPEILWAEPRLEAPKWAEDAITVKRSSNLKEATVEAWGLVDGQPVSSRFRVLLYDDVIARDEVSSSEKVEDVTSEFENSLFLTASDPPIVRYVATFQDVQDTTTQILERQIVTLRKRVGIGPGGESLFWSEEKLAWFKQNLSPKAFALQVLLDPKKAKGDEHVGFKQNGLELFDSVNLNSLNLYLIVDPAGNTKDSNSYYSAQVVGLSPDKRYKWVDGVLDKLDLDGRTAALKALLIKYQLIGKPILRVFYEQRAMQADIEHIRGEMRRDLWEYEIVPVGTNTVSKDQRIEWLIPVFKVGLFQAPKAGIKYRPTGTEWAGQEIDLVKKFIELEYDRFPFSSRKDCLDTFAWLKWPEVERMLQWPRPYGSNETQVGGIGTLGAPGGWMSS
jgi:hypothetical protein